MNITTIEDGYQYRAHLILKKFAKDFECENEFQEDADAAAWKYRKELGEYFVNDISEYCGIQEAFNNKQ